MPDNLSSRVTTEKSIDDVVEYKTDYMVDDIVQKANIVIGPEESEAALPGKIMEAFNQGVQSSLFTDVSFLRPGTRINPRQFWLGSKNQVPELAVDNGERKGRKLSAIFSPYIQSQIHGQFDFFARHYGANGSYVVNVPPGMFAKAKASGKVPLILGEGTHVIHDKGFEFDLASAFVPQNSEHIEHEILHIIRVPEGKYGKITIDNEPKLLAPSPIPYVFKSRVFEYGGLINQRDDYINHSDIIHIIRVQAGYLTKAWINNEPVLLESRDEPYIYRSPQLVVDMNGDSHLWDATDNRITHGKLKRLIPPAKEVFVVNDKGTLKIVDHAETINDPDVKVLPETLKTSMQTINLPTKHARQSPQLSVTQSSKKSKVAREEKEISIISEQKQDVSEDVVFLTNDSLSVGIKIVVVYELSEPSKVIEKLLPDNIESHIESLAITEMGKMIQSKTSQELFASRHSNLAKEHPETEYEEKSIEAPVLDGSEDRVSMADLVKQKLATDLLEYGITLHRLNIGPPRILNAEIQNQMSQQAVMTATIKAQIANVKQQMVLESQEAERKAKVSDIDTIQANKNLIARAQAELDAAKKSAESRTVQAEAEAKADVSLSEGKAQGIRLVGEATAEALEKTANVYREHPEMLELKKIEAISASFQKANISIVSDNVGSVVTNMFTQFGRNTSLQQAHAVLDAKEEDNLRLLQKKH